jgi:hypothetical protein
MRGVYGLQVNLSQLSMPSPSSAGLLLIVTMMTAAIIKMINAITSPLLTLLPSPADAQGCVNVSCGVFYRRHTAQVVLLAIISSSN